MAISDEDIAFALDLFADVGPLSTRKMFGGLSIYCDGVIFAIVMSDGQILLKGQGAMQDRYAALGMQRWHYPQTGKPPTAMPYWHLTNDMLDDPETVTDLARVALEHLR